MHCRGAGGRTAGRDPLPSADPRRAAGHGSYRNPRLSTWGRPARSWFRVGTRWASGQRNRSSGTGSARAFASPDHSPLFLGAKLLTHTATCCRSARESHGRSRASGDGVVDAGRLDRAAPGASRPAATQTPAVLMVNVQTSPRAASLGCPGWLQAPSRPGAGRDVWQPQDWTLGLWTSIGPSSVSAENFFSPLRLPGRRRWWGPTGALRMAWCTHWGNYTMSMAGLPPGDAPPAAAVMQAWSDTPPGCIDATPPPRPSPVRATVRAPRPDLPDRPIRAWFRASWRQRCAPDARGELGQAIIEG